MLRYLGAIVLFAPLLSACASLNAYAVPLAPEQTSLIANTCSQVMGLRSGEYYYAMCTESLHSSLALKAGAEETEQAFGDCRRQGLAQGSPALSACMLEQSPAQAPGRQATAVSLVYPQAELQSDKSYFSVSNAIHWKREQYSCAQLGLEPGTGGFGHCVASLDAALFPDPN